MSASFRDLTCKPTLKNQLSVTFRNITLNVIYSSIVRKILTNKSTEKREQSSKLRLKKRIETEYLLPCKFFQGTVIENGKKIELWNIIPSTKT